MTTKIKLESDLKKAILAKDEDRKSIIRVMLGEIGRINKALSATEIEQQTISALKKMKENAILLANESEVNIISEYLPNMLTEDELSDVIEAIIALEDYQTIKDMGKVMNTLKNMYNGQYDGKRASDIIKTFLK